MAQRWMKAQDTFVAQLADGSQRFVSKGETLPASHELVKRDQAGDGVLFRPLDADEEETVAPAPKSAPAKAEARPARAAGKAS
jgi:hypothetical protein